MFIHLFLQLQTSRLMYGISLYSSVQFPELVKAGVHLRAHNLLIANDKHAIFLSLTYLFT